MCQGLGFRFQVINIRGIDTGFNALPLSYLFPSTWVCIIAYGGKCVKGFWGILEKFLRFIYRTKSIPGHILSDVGRFHQRGCWQRGCWTAWISVRIFFESKQVGSFTNIIGLSLGADGVSPPQMLSGLVVIGLGTVGWKACCYRHGRECVRY